MRAAEAMIELTRQRKAAGGPQPYAPVKPPALRRLHEAGLPVPPIEQAVKVLEALAERGLYLQDRHGQPPAGRRGARRGDTGDVRARPERGPRPLRARGQGAAAHARCRGGGGIVAHTADELGVAMERSATRCWR